MRWRFLDRRNLYRYENRCKQEYRGRFDCMGNDPFFLFVF